MWKRTADPKATYSSFPPGNKGERSAGIPPAEVKRTRRSVFGFSLLGIATLAILLFVMNLIFPLPHALLSGGYSDALVLSDGRLNGISLSENNTLRLYVPPNRIPARLRQLILSYEDKYFYFHPGVNPFSVARSFAQYIRYGRFVSGASTLSMQVARMMEPKRRTFGAKLIETFRAFQLEWRYTKDEILGLYLNKVPMGGNLEGIGSGAYYYFGKLPESLSVGEMGLLIGIPQNPNAARPDIQPAQAVRVRNKVLHRLRNDDAISESEYRSALVTRPTGARRQPPLLAPHLSLSALHEGEGKRTIPLTFDPSRQLVFEKIVAGHRRELNDQGIKNVGVLLVENRTGDVLAWIGGFDYGDRDENRIDAVRIPRSPGSTLKPFIYGQALDSGLITPKWVLYDVQRYYAGYNVENFDKTYHGPVTAEEALTRSLNTPAVYLLQKLHRGSLFPLAESLGLNVRKGDDVGLSMALGANPLSLFELVKNYTAFSNQGRVRELRYVQSESPRLGKRIMSEEAAYLVSEMLSQGTRLDVPRSWEFSTHLPRLAWKTGTSFGSYDALCVGYNPKFTLGVWVGNADRTPSKALVGSKAAAPLFFELFNALGEGKGPWFNRPARVQHRLVSAASGKLPTKYTKHTVWDDYIPGVSPMDSCDRLVPFYIDRKTGKAVADPEGKKVKTVIYDVYPPEALAWARENRIGYVAPPAVASTELKNIRNNPSLRVVSPLPDKKYFLNPHLSIEKQKIPLLAQPFADSTYLYWFMNGKLRFQGLPSRLHFLLPEIGRHTLYCVDNQGRSGSVTFEIKKLE